MKKLFAVLAALFLLAVIACSGGGGDQGTNNESSQKIDAMTTVMEDGAKHYNDQISSGATSEEAGNQTIVWLEKQDGVVDAYFDDAKNNIIVEDKTGITTVIIINDEFLNDTKTSNQSKLASSIVTKASISQSDIKSIILKPFDVFLCPNPSAVYDTLKIIGSEVTYLENGDVTVQSFAELKDYDIIYYFGHGGISKNRLTDEGDRLLYIGTGEQFSSEKMTTYTEELKKLGVNLITDDNGNNQYLMRFVKKESGKESWRDTFGVTSLFIEAYSKNLKATVVYIDACQSLASEAMWKAFKKNGAKSYLGWDNDVAPTKGLTFQYPVKIFTDLFKGLDVETAFNNLGEVWVVPNTHLRERDDGKAKLPLSSDTYAISGQVTLNGSGLSGVAVALMGASSASRTTDSSGNYNFTGLANGSYTVTPSKTGYAFSPSSTAVTASGADKPNINFTATASTTPKYTISGQVTGAVISGVTITLTGTGSASTTTDPSGNYSFINAANGSYTVTPSLSGYTFTPTSRSVTVSNTNLTGQNFTATASTTTYLINGTIHVGSNSGAVLSGATVSIAGQTYTTDSTGNFYIAVVSAGTYSLTISKSGYDTYTNSAYYVGSDQIDLNFYLTQSSTSGDYTSPNIGTLKYVPAGSFQRDGTPTNISTVSAFRMSKYEITRAQYLAIMGTDPSATTYSSGTSDPVQNVTWYDAVEFCNKLSIAEGLNPVYTITGRTPATGYPITNATVTAAWSNNGYRLPTEMEWMWAAMGATAGATGYIKAFAGSTGSNAIGDYAWTWENSLASKSHPVGTKLGNELGLHDMSGNVWEWCWDWYADNGTWPYYAISGTVTNYRGVTSGAGRVLRGGGWNYSASHATVAYRDGIGPIAQIRYLGFRVVRP